jgi:hypothetical protein
VAKRTLAIVIQYFGGATVEFSSAAVRQDRL